MSDNLVKRYTTYNVMMSKESGKYISSPDGKWVLFTDHADRIEELEAKLAKAVSGLKSISRLIDHQYSDELYTQSHSGWENCGDDVKDTACITLAELKGETQ